MSYKSKKRSNDYQSDDFVVDDNNNNRGAKKAKTSSSGPFSSSSSTQRTDSNGDVYWDISSHRRVTISEFRGKSLVSIREYYEKDGQELPGKKGISLPIEQFNALIGCLPEIEQVLSAKGIQVPRPAYNGIAENKDEDEDEDEEEEREASGKKNIDATSDEDEE